MGQFEKLCWLWNQENGFGIRRASETAHAKVVRFERLFSSITREETFSDVLNFLTRFPGGQQFEWNWDFDILDRKVHSTQVGRIGHWREWDPDKCFVLHKHCGELMLEFGYGTESEWQDRLAIGREAVTTS